MPGRPLHYCAEPGCPVLLARGPRCPAHARAHEHRRPNLTARRWYHTERWSRLRLVVLRDALYACQSCGRVTHALEVDHIRKHDGNARLFWARANLQALCASCHLAKTIRGE